MPDCESVPQREKYLFGSEVRRGIERFVWLKLVGEPSSYRRVRLRKLFNRVARTVTRRWI